MQVAFIIEIRVPVGSFVDKAWVQPFAFVELNLRLLLAAQMAQAQGQNVVSMGVIGPPQRRAIAGSC